MQRHIETRWHEDKNKTAKAEECTDRKIDTTRLKNTETFLQGKRRFKKKRGKKMHSDRVF